MLRSEQPAVSAATFTSNAAAAAPVRLTRESSDCGHLRAVVVNAGNANACTGKQGLADAARMRLLTANHLRLPVEQVAVCSTGLIGLHLPMDKIEPGIAAAAAALPGGGDAKAAEHFAAAIRTTDKHAKTGALRGRHAGGRGQARVRGQGLRHDQPQHGDHALLRHLRRGGGRRRVDARCCTAPSTGPSTASPWTGRSRPTTPCSACATAPRAIKPGEEGLARLGRALDAALLALALSIVADGEGSTRTMKLTVTGAKDESRAEAVARAVANSPLVKTAFFGRDPNWGRIMQAIGQALGRDGHDAPPARISYEDMVIVEHGQPAPLGESQQGRLAEIMHQPEIDLTVALNGPGAEATIYFSDLTHDYVTLNAEYST